jgi:NAD(P)H-dependent flavin oxidoreductase YrpB (nitropropane dioxygenase family)/CTP:molybdopterin cytidylyltransferase MocA
VTTAGLVLAAGAGRRYGQPKAPVVVDGERLVDRSVRLLRAGGCSPIVVVLGAWVDPVADADRVVVNQDWHSGMGSSLRAGLAALDDDVDRVVVALVDHIGLMAPAVARLVASPARLAAAAYDGERRNPVLIGREHWAGVAESAVGDRGARDYLDEHAAEVDLVEVGDVATAEDLDRVPRTPLCEAFEIEVPVFNAGMGAAARAELAAAVSNAGGFGVLGASGVPPDLLSREVTRTRELTSQPFGINVIIAEDPSADLEEDRRLFRDQIRAAGRAGAAAVVLFWGDPAPFVPVAHDAGLKVLLQVGSVAEAIAAAEVGVDAVIAQGVEAGGHVRGTMSIWDLLPATVPAVAPVPVLASGGIGDGVGFARALSLGAQAASLGTRFLATDEANAHPEYKRRVVASSAADTVYTTDLYNIWWPDAPHRTLRNRTYAEWVAAGRPAPGDRPGDGTVVGTRRSNAGDVIEWPRYATGVVTPDFEGDLDLPPMWAGESCSVVNDIRPAGEVVRDLASRAAAVLSAP